MMPAEWSTALIEPFGTIAVTRALVVLSVIAFGGLFTLLLRDLWRQKAVGPGLWIPLTLGLGLRLFWILATQPDPLSDFAVYWHYADAFAHGNLAYEELSRHPAIAVLYSVMMTLFGGQTLWAGWTFNLLTAAAMLITTYALARHWLGARAACLSLSIAAVMPQFITYTALMATETPTVACMLLTLWALAYSRNTPTRALFWVALGVLGYGMVLLRSSCLLLLALAPLAMLISRWPQWRQVVRQGVITGATLALLLATWVFHQYLIGGQAKLFWGIELWLSSAIQYERGGRYTDPKDMTFYARVRPYYTRGTTADLVTAYAIIGEESLAVIRRDPLKYLAFGTTRMKNILWTAQTGLRWCQKGSSRMAQWPPRVIKTLAVISNVFWQILLCLAALGLLLRPWRWPQASVFAEGWLLTVGFCGAWFGFHYLTAVASERYGFQIMPLVLLLAVAGGWTLVRAVLSHVTTKMPTLPNAG